MALFLNLYLAHLLADYAFQPGKLVAAKREGAPGLLLHTSIVGVATAVVLWRDVVPRWYVVVLVMGVHLMIETLTIATRMGTRTRGLFVFVFDQTLHVLSIALLVWAFGAWRLDAVSSLAGVTVDTATLALIDAFGTVTLLGSILVFETTGAFIGDEGHDTAILRFDGSRALGMLERAAALALAVWATPAAAIAAFLPRLGLAAKRSGADRSRLLVGGAAGLGLCLASYAVYALIVVLTKAS